MNFFILFLLIFMSIPLFSSEFIPRWVHPDGASCSGNILEMHREKKGYYFSRAALPEQRFAGRFVRISGEVSGENICPGGKLDGGAVVLSYLLFEKKKYLAFPLTVGTLSWKSHVMETQIPVGAKEIRLSFGLQNTTGIFRLRNLKIDRIGFPLDFNSRANMALQDEVPCDGKGGWSDQGPKNDGRSFLPFFYRGSFGGIPFHLIPKGKSVLTMGSEQFSAGPVQVVFPLPEDVSGKCLYLLHTLCWGALPDKEIGWLEVIYKDGDKDRISLRSRRDVADWWNPAPSSNAVPVFYGTSGQGGSVAVYLSRFPLKEKMLRSISIHSAKGKSIWILAGGTISSVDVPLPEFRPYVIEAGAEWRAVKRFLKNRRVPNSALDVSAYLPEGPAGRYGRLIRRNGHLVFEKKPDEKVRFFTCAIEGLFQSKEDIDLYMREIRKNGYNMIRTHFFDAKLMRNAKFDLDFSPADLDLFDYMIFSMKKHGIYLNFDCMTSWNGYSPGALWQIKDRNLKKNSIYFDPSVRENWRKGVEALLCRRNPYTGTRLIEDPVLAMTIGFNEQEFAFIRPFDSKLVAPHWRAFLRKRYRTMDAFRKKNPHEKCAYNSFDDIPCFTSSESLKNQDAALFLKETESEILAWYRSELTRMGYRGLFSSFNMSKNLHYSVVRNSLDFISMNAYHAHPGPDSKLQDQSSSISRAGSVFRELISTRHAGKPFVITEHSHVFWNRYRYEQAFVTGAYAAFQNVDSLAVHAAPYSVANPGRIRRFQLWHDPVSAASEFLTFFAFMRGDVRPAEGGVRIVFDADRIYSSQKMGGGFPFAQTCLALMTGFSSECRGLNVPEVPLCGANEIRLPIRGVSSVRSSTSGFSDLLDSLSDGEGQTVPFLKSKGILPASNRSNGTTFFESSTGELRMDTRKKFLSVNTPRLQGICSETGGSADLGDIQILSMSTSGCLAAVALDGMKPLREARRIVLVYSTNALNRGMRFTSPDMTRLLSDGLDNEILLQTGRFRIRLKNINASAFRLYPLDLAGNRMKPIPPERTDSDSISFSVDTAEIPALFFEVVTDSFRVLEAFRN